MAQKYEEFELNHRKRKMTIFAGLKHIAMTGSEILKYCHFYKEEANPPFEQKDGRRLLWLAEKWLCEEGSGLIDDTNPKFKIASYIAAYVGKWSPYEFADIMEVYFSRIDDATLKEQIMKIYC